MDWRVKAGIQWVFSVIPGGEALYLRLQKKGGTLLDFENQCDNRVGDFKNMVGHLESTGFSINGKSFFEVGTGWYPTSPLCLYLTGSTNVITTDAYRFMQPDLTLRCVQRMTTHLDTLAEVGHCPPGEVKKKHAALQSALEAGKDLSAATNGAIVYRAPAPTGRSNVPAGSIDIVFSNGTLEHIPKHELVAFFSDSFRMLRPGGAMFHNVTPSDFYSHFDQSITPLNYLRYSERAWKKWNNPLHYQNRLRAVEFTRMSEAAGFEILLNTSVVTDVHREHVRAVPIAKEFKHYTEDELAVQYFSFVARKPA
jgi:predicted SAM-dependent methyltransferase